MWTMHGIGSVATHKCWGTYKGDIVVPHQMAVSMASCKATQEILGGIAEAFRLNQPSNLLQLWLRLWNVICHDCCIRFGGGRELNTVVEKHITICVVCIQSQPAIVWLLLLCFQSWQCDHHWGTSESRDQTSCANVTELVLQALHNVSASVWKPTMFSM